MDGVFSPFAMVSAVVAVAVTIVTFVIVTVRMPHLPDQVPSHFGYNGKPDAWGGKRFLWLFPGLSLFCVLVIGGALAWEIKEVGESARRDTEMMSAMTAFLTVMTLMITIRTFAVAEKREQGLGWWVCPAFVVGLILTGVLYQ